MTVGEGLEFCYLVTRSASKFPALFVCVCVGEVYTVLFLIFLENLIHCNCQSRYCA